MPPGMELAALGVCGTGSTVSEGDSRRSWVGIVGRLGSLSADGWPSATWECSTGSRGFPRAEGGGRGIVDKMGGGRTISGATRCE